MKRWAVAAVVLGVTAATGAGWFVADLRDDLEAARERAQQIDLAKAASDREAERHAKTLRTVRGQLRETRARLERKIAQLREIGHAGDFVSHVADEKFCFNPYDARFSGWVRGPLVADVDGDGAEDRVYTVGRPTLLGRSCRYFVVAETGGGTYAARITEHRLSFDGPSSFQLYLAPVAAAQIDGAGGSEIVVHVTQGASARFAVLYTLTGGKLSRVRVDDEPWDELTYLGSLCCGGAFDCTDGYLVASGYGRPGNGPRYAVTRDVYRLAGATLQHVRTERHRVRWDELERFGEFGGRALDRCDDFVRAPEFPLASNVGSFVTGAWARRGDR